MSFPATCLFNDGYIQEGGAQQVHNIDNEKDCAIGVKLEYLEASGATWYLNNSCWAEFGEFVTHSFSHRACAFQGFAKNIFSISKSHPKSHLIELNTAGYAYRMFLKLRL